MPSVQTLVLTVIGDDRTGLVKALADVVTENGGNWERSQLAELAGKFAGIVVVSVAPDRVDQLRAALQPIAGLLDVTVHRVAAGDPAGDAAGLGEQAGERVVRIDVLGNDRPGIVRELSGVLSAHGLNVDELTTTTREAPMAGGQLFEAKVTGSTSAQTDLTAMREDLERLAGELQIDLSVSGT